MKSYKKEIHPLYRKKGDEGLTYIIHYGVETSKDGAEEEALREWKASALQ